MGVHNRPTKVHWRARIQLESVCTTVSYAHYGVLSYYIGTMDTSPFLVMLIVITNSGGWFIRPGDTERCRASSIGSWDNSSDGDWARWVVFKSFGESRLQIPGCEVAISHSWMYTWALLDWFLIGEVTSAQLKDDVKVHYHALKVEWWQWIMIEHFKRFRHKVVSNLIIREVIRHNVNIISFGWMLWTLLDRFFGHPVRRTLPVRYSSARHEVFYRLSWIRL